VTTYLTLEFAHKIATKVQNMIVNRTGATRVVVHTETNS
jgi:divalent metal cation (Fe/Co/Zn/Cd) transporter